MYPGTRETRRARRVLKFNPVETPPFEDGPDPRSTRRAFDRVRLRLAAAQFGVCLSELGVRDFLYRDAGGAELARLMPGVSRSDVESALRADARHLASSLAYALDLREDVHVCFFGEARLVEMYRRPPW
jgi:hypothetical protein